MKRMRLSFGALLVLFVTVFSTLYSQSEDVPTNNPVYNFLKRMEVKGVVPAYHDVVLPLSRRQVANLLKQIKEKEAELTSVERGILQDLFIEFQFDLFGTTEGFHTLFESPEQTFGSTVEQFFSEKEKFLYAYSDSNFNLFVNGLLTWDARRSTGDALGGANATFVQGGGRIRGTVLGRLGYYLQATNAQFWGSRDVLERDKLIGQSYTLQVGNAQNFDFAEGHVRYDADLVSLQVGRERVLWGGGYGDKMILSDNPRVFDFLRADLQYKFFTYTFLHAWLLGKRSSIRFALDSDTSFFFNEPVIADKYFAAHRFGLSFPSVVDLGFQEMAIYSNRSPDLAYLNPLILIESAQRSRDERDNIFWAFDVQTHFLNPVELHGTILFDDINFPKWGTNSWENKYAFQIGAMAVDPFGFANVSVAAEYTRIEPFTFSHGRSRDNNYGSLGRILGHHIGPNSDSWFFRIGYLIDRKFIASASFEAQREGENVYDPVTGMLVKNVGGDFLQPHRDGKDSDTKEFLGGTFVRTNRFQASIAYEIVNEIFLDLRYEMQVRKDFSAGKETTDHDFGLVVRVDF